MVKEAKKRKTTTILDAYRLLSRSIVVVDKDHIGVRFETFFSGKYQDRFYLVCEYDSVSGHLSVWKHTLPPFVPLKQLENDHLNRNFDVKKKKI
jgi:centromere protein O